MSRPSFPLTPRVWGVYGLRTNLGHWGQVAVIFVCGTGGFDMKPKERT